MAKEQVRLGKRGKDAGAETVPAIFIARFSHSYLVGPTLKNLADFELILKRISSSSFIDSKKIKLINPNRSQVLQKILRKKFVQVFGKRYMLELGNTGKLIKLHTIRPLPVYE